MPSRKTEYDVLHINTPVSEKKIPTNIWVTGLELKSSCATYSIQFSENRIENSIVQLSHSPTISQFIRKKGVYAGSFWTQNLHHSYELAGNVTNDKVMAIPHFYYLDDVVRYFTNGRCRWQSFIIQTRKCHAVHILILHIITILCFCLYYSQQTKHKGIVFKHNETWIKCT